jgi:hypothetical protein
LLQGFALLLDYQQIQVFFQILYQISLQQQRWLDFAERFCHLDIQFKLLLVFKIFHCSEIAVNFVIIGFEPSFYILFNKAFFDLLAENFTNLDLRKPFPKFYNYFITSKAFLLLPFRN